MTKTMHVRHKIKNVSFEKGFMLLTVDDKTYKIRLSSVSKKLIKASDSVLNDYRISPSGYGIHWPQIDEDLSINALINRAAKRIDSSHSSIKRIKV